MGIIVSIVIAVVGGLLIDSFRTKKNNTNKINNFNDEVFTDFNNLFNNILETNNYEENLNHLTYKIYHLAFMKIGKEPVKIDQLGMMNLPEQLKQQVKFTAVYNSIKESLSETLDFIKVNNYKMDYNETFQTFDVMVNETCKMINKIQ